MPPRRLPQRLLIRFRRIFRNDQLVLAVLAILVGLAAGVGTILFRLLLGGVQFLAYGFPSERVAGLAAQLPWWHLLLAPTAGGLLIGLLVHLLMPGRRPEGVPAVMTGCALESGRMPLRRGLAAALISAGSLGVGASVGREGPVVHLGVLFGVEDWALPSFV